MSEQNKARERGPVLSARERALGTARPFSVTRRCRRLILVFALGLGAGVSCLDRLVEDVIDPTRFFGDAGGGAPQHVEDAPEYAANVAMFPTSVAYLRAYADEVPIWYWNVPGPLNDFIAPMYVLVDQNGAAFPEDMRPPPIIDVIPGDAGYTPWWRLTMVRITDQYAGERIWSREAVEAGRAAGILEAPEPTDQVINCPVVQRDVRVDLGYGNSTGATPVWYRNKNVHWIRFARPHPVPKEERNMPKFPVYVLQRINQGAPIYEFATGVDLDGDGDLNNSNNIFANLPGKARYSPLWYLAIVRTSEDYVSIDTSSSTVGFASERRLFTDDSFTSTSSTVKGLIRMRDTLINCPVQSEEGTLL